MSAMREDGLVKYPRTRHLEGSGIQKGDDAGLPLSSIARAFVVVEEKFDGANCGISFQDGQLKLQSRGHFLTGGPREKHFNLLKQWAAAHEPALRQILEDRFIMFGEWMYASHSMFYDRLPHFFLEFDIYDRRRGAFLDTATRKAMLDGTPVVSVPVIGHGPAGRSLSWLEEMVGPSLGRSGAWADEMQEQAIRTGQDPEQWKRRLDLSCLSEGLYIKHEEDGVVKARYKFVRRSFTQTLIDNDEHWQKRPILPNRLAPGVDIFSPTKGARWPRVPVATSRKKGP